MRSVVYRVLLVVLLVVATPEPTTGLLPGSLDTDAQEPTRITNCTTLTEPGRYVLKANLRPSAGDSTENSRVGCLEIGGDDIQVDGAGHSIVGSRQTGLVGVFIGPGPTDNVTIQDVTISDWSTGIYAEGGTDTTINDVATRMNRQNGLFANATRNLSIVHSTFVGNGHNGIGLLGTSATRVGGVNASANAQNGITIEGGENNTVRDTRANDNDVTGIGLNGTASVTVADSVTTTNRGYGLVFEAVRTGETVNTTASGNRDGIFVLKAADVTVRDSQTHENRQNGVFFFGARNSLVTNATAERNGLNGVAFLNTRNSRIDTSNVRSSGQHGIVLENSTGNTVRGSITAANEGDGLLLYNASDDSIIATTTASNAENGVELYAARRIELSNSNAYGNREWAFYSTGGSRVNATRFTFGYGAPPTSDSGVAPNQRCVNESCPDEKTTRVPTVSFTGEDVSLAPATAPNTTAGLPPNRSLVQPYLVKLSGTDSTARIRITAVPTSVALQTNVLSGSNATSFAWWQYDAGLWKPLSNETVTGENALAATITTFPDSERTNGTIVALTRSEAPPVPSVARINVTNRRLTENSVTIDLVTLPHGGFVAVHDISFIQEATDPQSLVQRFLDSILGTSKYLQPGTHRNVSVELDRPVQESQLVVSVVYNDTNDNREYDFKTSNATVDNPYVVDGEIVANFSFLEVPGSDARTTTPTSPTQTPTPTTSPETPMTTEVVTTETPKPPSETTTRTPKTTTPAPTTSRTTTTYVESILPDSGNSLFNNPLQVEGGKIGPPRDPDNDGLYEDVNGDDAVTDQDGYALATIVTAIEEGTLTLSEAQQLAFDFNGDGKLTHTDATALLADAST